MKKTLAIILALVMSFSLAACGGTGSGTGGESTESVAEWTRQGYFENEAGDMLYILPGDPEAGQDGWVVGLMFTCGEMHGDVIQQEGSSLHGNLTSEYLEGEPDYIVTVSEEGEDGILCEVEGGESYHFTPKEMPEVAYTMSINTEGLGEIAYAEEGEELQFDDEFPSQSAYVNMEKAGNYTIGARENTEGWKFVRWTKNGEDFSEEPIIEVYIEEDSVFVAVFEYAE